MVGLAFGLTLSPKTSANCESLSLQSLRPLLLTWKSWRALLHAGDTKKAIQQLIAAPVAPNTPQTFKALQALHPAAPPIEPRVNASLGPSDVSPIFSKELVKRSLASFGPSSAGGLFHYKPSILVQCFKADSFHFGTTLTSIVNFLASGSAPDFLKPFLGGGSYLLPFRRMTMASGRCAVGTLSVAL